MARISYRGKWWIEYKPKPIPASCGVDWDWWHDDLDPTPNEVGGPAGDNRYGYEASEEACKRAIDEWIEENEE